jgi:hypothetical protein
VNPTDLPTAELAVEELLERSSERGFVLMSELQMLDSPELLGDTWIEDTITEIRAQGVEIIDDVADVVAVAVREQDVRRLELVGGDGGLRVPADERVDEDPRVAVDQLDRRVGQEADVHLVSPPLA